MAVIGRALTRLAESEQGDVKRLRGYEDQWRLRVREWRVRLTFDPATQSIEVLRILPRGSAYRRYPTPFAVIRCLPHYARQLRIVHSRTYVRFK